MSTQRYCFKRDDDGHNYMIPVEMSELFDKTLDDWEDDYVEFNNNFDSLRIDALTNWTFENPKEDA